MMTLHRRDKKKKQERSPLRSGFCPAADEMNNLDPVAIRKHCLWPKVPAHDLLIQLDRNSFRRQRKLAY